MSTAQEQGIESVLSTVAGTVFRSDTGEVLILLRDDPYVISVDLDGNTHSAYLSTIPPVIVAEHTGVMTADVSGWTTGWDA